MGKIAIEFQNISKQYALGSIGTGTLSRDLNRWWARIRGKEDPYLRIGEENNVSLEYRYISPHRRKPQSHPTCG